MILGLEDEKLPKKYAKLPKLPLNFPCQAIGDYAGSDMGDLVVILANFAQL